MKEGPDIAAIAALIGEPPRANMLSALMSGMALTAGELANEAGVMAQTASAHLAKLLDAHLISAESQGRHRYFRLAGEDVATALEGLMELAARKGSLRTRPGPRDAAMREARSCYDHLAGSMGVLMYEALVRQGTVIATADGLGLSEAGRLRLRAEGVDIDALDNAGRPLCRACLDWSERRHHLGGPVAAALLAMILAKGWAKRTADRRTLMFLSDGRQRFEAFLARTASPRLVSSGMEDPIPAHQTYIRS